MTGKDNINKPVEINDDELDNATGGMQNPFDRDVKCPKCGATVPVRELRNGGCSRCS